MTRVDPAKASVYVAAIASLGAVVTAIINARSSAERLTLQATIRELTDKVARLKRRLIDKHGEAADDVDNV